MDSPARTQDRTRGGRRAIAWALVYAGAMEQRVHFSSAGLQLAGILHSPADMKPGERRSAFMVLHGFGSNKDSTTSRTVAELFASLGYVALRFDMRGCGESDGARGRVAPPPLLLMHPANDTVTPTEQSIELFQHAGQPTDLHLVAGVDHFLMNEGNTLVLNLVRDWLAQRFPAR